ncbi:MAG: zinc-ribbon domain-containing protein [Lachnospiraceae bacterium]
MFCEKCGTKNSDGAKFCSGCGAPITSGAGNPNIPPVGRGAESPVNLANQKLLFDVARRGMLVMTVICAVLLMFVSSFNWKYYYGDMRGASTFYLICHFDELNSVGFTGWFYVLTILIAIFIAIAIVKIVQSDNGKELSKICIIFANEYIFYYIIMSAVVGEKTYGNLGYTGGALFVLMLQIVVLIVAIIYYCSAKANKVGYYSNGMGQSSDPNGSWNCVNCHRTNAAYVDRCLCGYTKEQSVTNGYWVCPNCHRTNAPYIGSCACGCNKGETKER